MARKGGVPANRVLNCLTLPQLMQHLRKRKMARARGADRCDTRRTPPDGMGRGYLHTVQGGQAAH